MNREEKAYRREKVAQKSNQKESDRCNTLTRRRQFFRIRSSHRTYDKRTNKFTINIAYETAAAITPRTVAVAEAFGLGLDEQRRFIVYENVELRIGPTDIVYITGDSGSGKSVLLKTICKDLGDSAISMADICIEADRPVVETVGSTFEEALELLSLVGLNDAFLFLRTYEELSDGQRYRYRIAKLVESGRQWWIMDEFAASLDRDTAKIVAFNLQKIARKQGKAVVAATTHTDLHEDLNPTVHVHKRFGKEIVVDYRQYEQKVQCSLVKEMEVTEGSMEDWKKLAAFHYRSHRVSPPRKILSLMRADELCGVIVYSYPPPTCFGRKYVMPRMTMRELNEKLSTISRVVIHPKYRAIGLGTKLVKDTVGLCGTCWVEMIAVMSKYNPFAEKAGMKKVAEQPKSDGVLRIVETLQELGFNVHLLSSEGYVLSRLKMLSEENLARIKMEFVAHSHGRFRKSFACDLPFGTKENYQKNVLNISLPKLASLIKICGVLMQTKSYLFWEKSTQSVCCQAC